MIASLSKTLAGLNRKILCLTVAAVLIISAYLVFRDDQSTDQPLLERVTQGSIENFISATGKLEPKKYVEVGAQVSGQVKHIHVEEGDVVKAGDLVLDIDATVFETRVQNTEASLEGKRAQLQQLEAELELATLRARRNKNLHEANAVSADTLLESQANEKILRARLRAMNAQIRADSASLAGDKATLGYAKIYAPIDGTIVSIEVREGQTLNANQNAPTLLKIADLNVLTLRAEVSEADVTQLSKGMPVYFKTFGDSQRRWHSKVRQVLPTPKVINDVVLYQALIDVDNSDGKLMDAMTTQVFFIQEQAKNTILLPLGAVRKNKEGHQVMVQTDDGLASVDIDLGIRNRTHAQVLSGLMAGDIVLVGNKARSTKDATKSAFGSPPKGGRRGI